MNDLTNANDPNDEEEKISEYDFGENSKLENRVQKKSTSYTNNQVEEEESKPKNIEATKPFVVRRSIDLKT